MTGYLLLNVDKGITNNKSLDLHNSFLMNSKIVPGVIVLISII